LRTFPWNRDFSKSSSQPTFQVAIDKIKLYLPHDLPPLNFDHPSVILFAQKEEKKDETNKIGNYYECDHPFGSLTPL
jgi:hypothetical protein